MRTSPLRSRRAALALGISMTLALAMTLATGAAAQLLVPSPQVWTQAHFPAAAVESFDDFGAALVTGDFNGDGYADLASGAPGEAFGAGGVGEVNVAYGGAAGLSAAGAETLQTTIGGYFAGSPGDHFGDALASGDFDGDGYDDLAVGLPSADGFPGVDAGAVQVFYGAAGGLGGAPSVFLYEGSEWIDDPPGALEHFGTALAAGDFDDDGFDELVIGVPGTTVSGKSSSGRVHILAGGPDGLEPANETLDQSRIHGGMPTTNDRFGAALAVGDFNGDGRDDLAVGAPGKWIGTHSLAGAAWVFRGTVIGLDTLTYTFLWQSTASGPNQAESYEHFGASLAAGDANRDGRADLAVGVPYQSRTTPAGLVSHSGAVDLFYGSSAGVLLSSAVYVDQASSGVAGELAVLDRFGATVVLGDTSGDGHAELVVGVPGENGTGAYQWFNSGLSGISLAGNLLRLQPGPGAPEAHDRFGAAIALGDFDGNGLLDVAVGAPGEDLGAATDAGQVHVRYSAPPDVIGH